MKLRQATRYAIWVTVHLASNPDKHLSAAELAEIYGVSQHHLAKVIRTLSVARIVSSTRGPGGGCTFIADPNKITIYDIILLFEHDFHLNNDDPPTPERNACASEVSRVLAEIDRITKATLQSVTIQTILKNARRSEARIQKAMETGAEPSPD